MDIRITNRMPRWRPIGWDAAGAAAAAGCAASVIANLLACWSRRCFHRRRALALPVAVESALDLHEPNDRPCNGQEDPPARVAGDRLRLAVLGVQIPYLGAREKRDGDRPSDEHQ